MPHPFKFIKQFLHSPTEIGAIAPSSDRLAELITNTADLKSAACVVELGSGNGVFTKKIIEKISEDCLFFAIESNKELMEETKANCPDATIYHDSANNITQYLQENKVNHCDIIISGLPWSSFDKTKQNEIMEEIIKSLSPSGKFLTFAYLHGLPLPSAKKFKSLLNKNFSSVIKTNRIWNNAPPALVYHCKK